MTNSEAKATKLKGDRDMKPVIENKGNGCFVLWPSGKPKRIRAPKEKTIVWKGETIILKRRKKKNG